MMVSIVAQKYLQDEDEADTSTPAKKSNVEDIVSLRVS